MAGGLRPLLLRPLLLRPLRKEQRSGRQPVTLTVTQESHTERPVASTTAEVALQE